MAHRILFASDLSARSDRALDRSVMLAKDMNGSVTLLHVLDKSAAQHETDDVIAQIRADLPASAAHVDIQVERGSPPKEIAAAAADCDMIVTGVARHTSLGDITLGTAVDYIVRRATVPVLVVKKRPLSQYQRLVVATDFSDCSRNAVCTAAALFPDAKLHLVHAYAIPYSGWLKSDQVEREIREEAEESMEKFLADPALKDGIAARLHPHIGFGHIETFVYRAIREHNAELLVLGTHGHSGFIQATIGSNATTMLTGAPSDVLMVRQNG